MTDYQSDLYQQVILEHNRKPRNFRAMDGEPHSCDGHNPLCGDNLTVYVKLSGERVIEDISFQGSGCAISKASASMMTAYLKGKSIDESKIIYDEFHKMTLGELDPKSGPNHLGKLAIFSGVREYPSRIKCATLAWHAMTCAVDMKGETTTE